MNFVKISAIFLLATSQLIANNKKIEVVATPPADAGRGLVRHSKTEIRHYSGTKGKQFYLCSKNNGKTWKKVDAPDTYPPNFGGISKESPAISQNPLTKEYIRVQPIRGYVFISKGGLDGEWGAVTKDGKLDFDWKKTLKKDPKGSNYQALRGIMRSPTFVNKGKRILIPTHSGSTSFHISDDGGLTWKKSKNSIRTPSHKIDEIDKGVRWQNGGVEASLVELKNRKLWAIVRSSQNEHYQSFSKDWGNTWTPAEPSPFFGTLTMPTLKKLKDGRIVASWTNTKALPEAYRSNKKWMLEKGHKPKGGEDAFTNRDSHHLAISKDDGKTWTGFREIILDEIRNHPEYATLNGRQDRGKHQSEIIELEKNKILISVGQHDSHRRLMIIDLSYLYEKERQTDFAKGSKDWTVHSYIPVVKGHCAYNRKEGSKVISKNGKKVLQVKRSSDAELINEKYEINYEKGGATWNFPNGKKGSLSIRFMLDKDNGGTQVSLTDRLFNACDETTELFSLFTINFKVGQKIGKTTLKANQWYNAKFTWKDANSKKARCQLTINGKNPTTLKLNKPSPNGISYIHFISTAEKEDNGLYLQALKAQVQ